MTHNWSVQDPDLKRLEYVHANLTCDIYEIPIYFMFFNSFVSEDNNHPLKKAELKRVPISNFELGALHFTNPSISKNKKP